MAPKSTKPPSLYQTFPDGWDFTPDVGNGQSRGEIFTPLWVVNKMITDVGLIPHEGVYDGDYSANSKRALECITARNFEPAVGTGNYTATILYHKLRYVKEQATRKDKTLDLPHYEKLLLTSVGSLYANDISCGNLQTTKNRLLGDSSPLDALENENYWVDYMVNSLSKSTKLSAASRRKIRKQVCESLSEAQTNWYSYTKSGSGVIDVAYEEATGKILPENLRKQVKEVLDKNIILFNGIVEKDEVDTDKNWFMPGWENVEWIWWEFQESSNEQDGYVSSMKQVSMKRMIKTGELKELRERKKTATGDEARDIQRRIVSLELEIYGVETPGSLFG